MVLASGSACASIPSWELSVGAFRGQWNCDDSGSSPLRETLSAPKAVSLRLRRSSRVSLRPSLLPQLQNCSRATPPCSRQSGASGSLLDGGNFDGSFGPGRSVRRWPKRRFAAQSTQDWDSNTISLESSVNFSTVEDAVEERISQVEEASSSNAGTHHETHASEPSADEAFRVGMPAADGENAAAEPSTSGRSSEAAAETGSNAKEDASLGQRVGRLFAFLRTVGPGGEWWNIEGSRVPLNKQESGQVFGRVCRLVAERPVMPLCALCFLVLASVSASAAPGRLNCRSGVL